VGADLADPADLPEALMMTPWWDGPMIGFDLETTSAEPDDARIVSAALVTIGAAVEGEERSVDRWSMIVNPGVEIPQEAIDVHGITNEMAAAGGDVRDALLMITERLDRAARARTPVVIMQARFDLTVTDRELRRVPGGELFLSVLEMLLVVDPLVVEKHLDRYRPKRVASHSLEDCCRVWNVPLEGVTHDATFDAIAACRLAWRLGKNGRVIRRTRNTQEREEFIELTQEWERVRGDLEALHEWQARIAWDEAARLEAYFRHGDERKGVPAQPDRVCAREWPVVPVDGRASSPAPREPLQSEAELTTPEWTR
jgi:DNA polymerase-3 subunit epsilon